MFAFFKKKLAVCTFDIADFAYFISLAKFSSGNLYKLGQDDFEEHLLEINSKIPLNEFINPPKEDSKRKCSVLSYHTQVIFPPSKKFIILRAAKRLISIRASIVAVPL